MILFMKKNLPIAMKYTVTVDPTVFTEPTLNVKAYICLITKMLTNGFQEI